MPGYTLVDPRPTVQENPFTFFVPSTEELNEIGPGVLVKLIFAADPPERKHGAERMWVEVTSRDGDRLTGKLDNIPDDIPGLTLGEEIVFRTCHVIAIYWEDENLRERFANSTGQERYFQRCFVDNAVIEGRACVQYLYREPPMEDASDRDPDSGWRLRADVSELSGEEYEDTPFSYVAIGVALNRDASFHHLLDAPIGSAFMRGEDDEFHPAEYDGDPIP